MINISFKQNTESYNEQTTFAPLDLNITPTPSLNSDYESISNKYLTTKTGETLVDTPSQYLIGDNTHGLLNTNNSIINSIADGVTVTTSPKIDDEKAK